MSMRSGVPELLFVRRLGPRLQELRFVYDEKAEGRTGGLGMGSVGSMANSSPAPKFLLG